MTILKTPGEIELMDQANAIVHRVLDDLEAMIVPGITTRELDRHAETVIRAAGAPADIGIDTRRQRIAIPFVDLDRVDVRTLRR